MLDIRNGGIQIPKVEARRFRSTPGPEKELFVHTVSNNCMNLNQKDITGNFPTKQLAGGEIVSLVSIANDRLSGIVLLIQRPKNRHLCADDWTEPGSAEDWEIVGENLISYKHCLKINQCDCIYSLLQTLFRDSVYSSLGWQLQEEPNGGKVVGLRIININNRRR